MSGRRGQRGGTVAGLPEATALFRQWRSEEWGWLKARVLWIAGRDGEYHADNLADLTLAQPNIIGAVVGALVRGHMLVSTGEHRRGSSEASHGRRSYVYVLTPKGLRTVEAMRAAPRELLPHRPVEAPPVLSLLDQETEPRPEPQPERKAEGEHDLTIARKGVDMDEFLRGIDGWRPFKVEQEERDPGLSWDAE